MAFKPAVWYPIATALTLINLVGVGFAAEPWHATVHAVLALAFGLWAQRLRRGAGGAGESELARIAEQLDQQAVALEDAQRTLANQSTQLTELQERVDFAERLLAQVRDRAALGARDKRE